MSLTALPTAPSRADPATFAARSDAFLLAIQQLGAELNAELPVVNDVVAQATALTNAAASAAASAAAAAASAQLAYAFASGVAGAYPSTRPTLLMDFTKGALDPRVTFTRASSGVYTARNGALTTAGNDVPRFDYDLATGRCRGLLIEQATTNRVTHSADFAHANWIKSGLRAFGSGSTVDNHAAPDGTMTADTVVEDANNTPHRISFNTGITAATTTCSVYIKDAGRRYADLQFYNGTDLFMARAVFDVVAGTIVSNPNGTASMTPAGNGWWRCSITGTATVASSWFYIGLSNGTTVNRTGDNASGLHLWGAQMEYLGFATSYVATNGATATRAADIASMSPGAWYRADRGTLLAAAAPRGTAAFAAFAAFNDGTAANRIQIDSGLAAGQGRLLIMMGGEAVAALSAGIGNARRVAAAAWQTNSARVAVDGALGTLDTSVVIPVVTRLDLGSHTANSADWLNGTLEFVAYWPSREPDATLQALSAV